jgi:glycosyltransferase involved in cell wall biosynthesis
VVVTTFRRPTQLVEVVRALLAQPMREIEVLVMDDGSNDGTRSAIVEILDPRVQYWNLGKLGVPLIANAGIARSSAPYVMLLHDHDRFEPSLLHDLSMALDRNPGAGFAFCGYTFYDADFANQEEKWLLDVPELIDGREFLKRFLMPRINSPVLCLAMIRKAALQDELMNSEFGGCADVELWHRLASRGDVAYVRKPLISVRGRDASSTYANPSATLRLMTSAVKMKERYLGFFSTQLQRRWQRSWRRQISLGGIYIAWKSFESFDWETLRETRRFMRSHGTLGGQSALALLQRLPPAVGLRLLRGIRGAGRRARRGTC